MQKSYFFLLAIFMSNLLIKGELGPSQTQQLS